MQTIKTKSGDVNTLNTGPIQFSNDWPGVFLTINFIQTNLEPLFTPSTDNVFMEDGTNDISNIILQNSLKSIGESLTEYLCEETTPTSINLNTLQRVELDISDEDDDAYQRVETGAVNIGGNIGYFIRGDNSMYFSMILNHNKQKNEHPLVSQLSDILGSCNAGNFIS